ncbi:hypothetical protein [Acidisoma silvae]|uniref:Uncharacterized protein n=1 Tax=Acidisoma silvae TaxID=2802396 RepID=A0A964DXY4_9PROT|nr:hypothetical protein [Acidisoma silvae]MCB8874364.1 hypothetical protein [Acidisoma silvae]
MARRPIVPRIEAALLCLLGLGFLMVLQTWFFPVYHFGLLLVIGVTLLNIAVGNLPRGAGPLRALLMTLLLLAIVAAVVVIGILLVPTLAQLGQGE